MHFPSFTITTNSKINLGLRVLGRRSDGFHDIESIFVAIDLGDTITVTGADELTVECHPTVTQDPEQNIVFRAARLYAERFPNDRCGAKIVVSKRIPAGAGLGGGSGDAAATLLSMAHLNGRPISDETVQLLEPLAAACGSDVPFFLHAGVALVTGRGEHVTPIDITLPWTVLVVCPGIHLNTALAYSTLGITCVHPSPGLRGKLIYAIENQHINAALFENDFERAVFPLHPILADIKQRLSDAGARFASMSGSGSSIYGLFESATEAAEAARALAGMSTYICAPITDSFRLL
jgi:4-diphosphocytidyl-2-C-methyl-D-erythritol kinase